MSTSACIGGIVSKVSFLPRRALIDPQIGKLDLSLIIQLGLYTTSATNWVCPTQVTLAKDLGCHRFSINKSLKKLESLKYIETQPGRIITYRVLKEIE